MNYKNRPPRRMNGMAGMLAKARTLPSVAAAAAQGAAALPSGERAAQAALDALLGRLRAAELQVARVRSVVTQIEAQVDKLPEGHPFAEASRNIVNALNAALTLPVATEQPGAPA